MEEKLKMLKKISVPFLCAAWLILFMPGCSIWNQAIEKTSSVEASEPGTQVLEKDVAKFISGIRPYREDADSIYRRACYFQERKKHKMAIEEFRKVLAIDPTNAKAYNGMGVSFDSLGEHGRAIQHYESALALDSNLHYVYNNLGYSYLLQGTLQSSIRAFQKAIDLDKDQKRYHNNLALAYAKEGLFERAYEEFILGGDDASARQNLARLQSESPILKNPLTGPTQPTLASTSHPAEGGNDTSGASKDSGPYFRGKISVNPPLQVAEAPSIGTEIPKNNEEPAEVNAYALSVDLRNLDQSNQYQDDSARDLKTKTDGVNSGANALAIPHKPAVASREEDHHAGTKGELRAIGGFPQIALPSRKASESESTIASQPTQAKALEVTGATQIEISNGNGIRHMARDMGEFLKAKGLTITRLTNSSHFRHGKTTIYYCDGYQQEAQEVAKEIPADSDMKKTDYLQRPNIKVKVLIGKDMAPFRVVLIEGKG